MGKWGNRIIASSVIAGFGYLGFEAIKDKIAEVDAFSPAITKSADQIALNPNAGISWSSYTAAKVTLPKEGVNTPDVLLADTYGETGVIYKSSKPHVRAAVACTALSLNNINWPADGLQYYQEGLKVPDTAYSGEQMFKAAETACLGTLATTITTATVGQPKTFLVLNGLAP